MAGNVTGELGGQPILLENAATEATLEALLQATLANSSNKSQAAKIQKAYEESVKKTTDNQKSNMDAVKRQTEAINKEKKLRDDVNEKLREEKEAREKLFNGLQELGQLVGKGLGVAFGTATPKISDFTSALSGIPIIGPIIGAMGNAIQAQTDRFRELSQVGADFGSGIDTVRNVAAQAGMSLDTFTSAIGQNSKNLAMLGGSASAGAKIFVAVNKSLQGPFQQGLARLGFSMEETAEYTAGYLAQQTRLGLAQGKTQGQLNEGAREYLVELDKLARVHGMSRKEAQAALDAQTQDKRFKLFYAQMGASGKETQSFMAGLSTANKEFSDGIADLMMNSGVPSANNEMAQSIALNSPRLVALSKQLQDGTISQEAANEVVREESARLTELAKTQGKSQAQFTNLGSSVFLANSALIGLENYGKKAATVTAEQAKAMADNTKNAANLDKSLLDLRNQFMTALQPALKIFEGMLTSGVGTLGKFVTAIALAIKTFMETVADKGLGAAISGAISSVIKEAVIGLFSSPGAIAGLVGAIALLFGAAAVKQVVVQKLAELLTQKGGPGGSVPDVGGKGGGKVGKFLKGAAVMAAGGFAIDAAAGALGAGKNVQIDEAADDRNWEKASVGEKMQSAIPRGIEKIGSLFFLDNLVKEAKADRIAKETAYINNKQGTPTAPVVPGSPPTSPTGSIAPEAVEVAKTTTAKEVRELSEALKTLDYGKLLVDDKIVTSMETGTLKMRQLRGEVGAMSAAFKELNNVGLDKITEGLGRLDASFKGFSKSFAEDFMTKFRELDKKSQETLLTDLNDKMEQLNTNVKSLITLQEENTRHGKDTSRNTKYASGRV